MFITLMTDFGLNDPYVGSMKGIILGINPDVKIIDITHDIEPQNVEEAAFILKNTYSSFPMETIHVVVVDPGVGSDRAVLAVRTEKYTFLAPDNGVLKYVFAAHHEAKVFHVTDRTYFLSEVSNTFHGRDIFAPVAAHLSRGVKVETLGEPFSDYMKGEIRKPVVESKEILGEIVHIDRFGNGITNIDEKLLVGQKKIRVLVKSWKIVGLSRNYLDVPEGEVLAIIGSGGTVEISINQGNAKERMDLHVGDPVTVIFD